MAIKDDTQDAYSAKNAFFSIVDLDASTVVCVYPSSLRTYSSALRVYSIPSSTKVILGNCETLEQFEFTCT